MAEEVINREASQTAEELAASFVENAETPTESATPPETPAVTPPPEPEYDFEFDPGDGSGAKRFTNKQLAERLTNYGKLESEIGTTKREKADLKKQLEDFRKGQTAAPATPEAQAQSIDLANADLEDPNVLRQAFGMVLTQNQELSKALKDLPDQIRQERTEASAEKEMLQVMNNNENLKAIDDPLIREAAVKLGAAVAEARNKASGKPIYTDYDAATNALFSILKGEAKPTTTQQAFVKNLRASGGEVLSTNQSKPVGDVVAGYKEQSTPEGRAGYLDSLDDAGREAVDNAIQAGL